MRRVFIGLATPLFGNAPAHHLEGEKDGGVNHLPLRDRFSPERTIGSRADRVRFYRVNGEPQSGQAGFLLDLDRKNPLIGVFSLVRYRPPN